MPAELLSQQQLKVELKSEEGEKHHHGQVSSQTLHSRLFPEYVIKPPVKCGLQQNNNISIFRLKEKKIKYLVQQMKFNK